MVHICTKFQNKSLHSEPCSRLKRPGWQEWACLWNLGCWHQILMNYRRQFPILLCIPTLKWRAMQLKLWPSKYDKSQHWMHRDRGQESWQCTISASDTSRCLGSNAKNLTETAATKSGHKTCHCPSVQTFLLQRIMTDSMSGDVPS